MWTCGDRCAAKYAFSLAQQDDFAHRDTTRADIEVQEAQALNTPIAEGRQPALKHPFKWCMDIATPRILLTETSRGCIPMVMVTCTNNSGGGQPVSMENIKRISAPCRRQAVPFFIDACRFGENVCFIKQRKPGYASKSPLEIAGEMFSYFDGCTMSAKKDVKLERRRYLFIIYSPLTKAHGINDERAANSSPSFGMGLIESK